MPSFRPQKVTVEAGSGWSAAVADYVRQNDQTLLEEGTRLLRLYEDEMLPCESLSEFCDVMGKLRK